MMKSPSPSSTTRPHKNGSSNYKSSTGSTIKIQTPLPNKNNNNAIRLRSPKGSSPFSKTTGSTSTHWYNISWWWCWERVGRILYKPKSSPFLSTLFILFPIAWMTFQRISSISSSTTSISSTNLYPNAPLLDDVSTTTTTVVTTTLQSFDPTHYHIIPKSIYQPKSSNPIQVIYIGRLSRQNSDDDDDDNNNDQYDYNENDTILDALQRSSYTKVMMSYLYSTNNATHPIHSLHQRQYHTITGSSIYSRKQPMVVIVDWSALSRDCHILQRIVFHILQQQSKQEQQHVYMLLLDSSASSSSSQSVVCTDSSMLKKLIPNQNNIQIAKRSIINNRRYNYTKQWIESGSLISNPHNQHENHKLYWSGYVPQSFVLLLDIAVNDFTKRSNNNRRRRWRRHAKKDFNTHHRPIDVSHYWKSATTTTQIVVPNEHQYYYNRLRQIVQQQINETGTKIIQQQTNDDDENDDAKNKKNSNSARWVESVGIDTQISFQKSDSSAESSNDNDDDEDNEDNSDLSRSSVHVAVLASSKIVVVTLADEYEDHDARLMEALASGAMVLCDTMIAPPFGLIHKTNIVFFDSNTKLDQYIRYYLDPANDRTRQEIARHGVEYALGRHRSWHTLEALLFGKALTRTDKHPLMDTGPNVRKSTMNHKNNRPTTIIPL